MSFSNSTIPYGITPGSMPQQVIYSQVPPQPQQIVYSQAPGVPTPVYTGSQLPIYSPISTVPTYAVPNTVLIPTQQTYYSTVTGGASIPVTQSAPVVYQSVQPQPQISNPVVYQSAQPGSITVAPTPSVSPVYQSVITPSIAPSVFIPPASVAQLCFIYAVSDGPPINVSINGSLAFQNLTYTTQTKYVSINPGTIGIQITNAQTGQVLYSSNSVVIASPTASNPRSSYTMVIHGTGSNLQMLVAQDTSQCPPRGKAFIRFIHAAALAPMINFYITSAALNSTAAALSSLNIQPMFSNVSYGNSDKPEYQAFSSGNVDMYLSRYNDVNRDLALPNWILADQGVYTVVAMGIPNNTTAPLTVVMSENSREFCMMGR